MIGLSGLITPSLDEMVHVAREMKRRGFKVPLLIGGATTSPAHTAVKIDPEYDGPVVYVKDASRAVGVCQSLITPETPRRVRAQDQGRPRRAARTAQGPQGEGARRSRWPRRAPTASRATGRLIGRRCRSSPGIRTFENIPLEELMRYIDWMPFFNAWEFAGKFPDILTDPVVGEAASNLYADARRMLKQMIAGALGAAQVPSSACSRRIRSTTTSRSTPTSRAAQVLHRLHLLRQQKPKPTGQPHFALADFVAPQGLGHRATTSARSP